MPLIVALPVVTHEANGRSYPSDSIKKEVKIAVAGSTRSVPASNANVISNEQFLHKGIFLKFVCRVEHIDYRCAVTRLYLHLC